jgi:prepilin peptidase CpaA
MGAAMTPTDALILLVAVAPVAIWAAASDLQRMKIPNLSVGAMVVIWTVLGAILLPWQAWAWGFALGAMTLAVTFLLFAAGPVGAGDAKFGAAMAPFFIGAPLDAVLILLATCLLAAVVVHRVARAIPLVRRATPGWKSWNEPRDFPVGLALAGMVIIYLASRPIVA